MLTHQVSPEGLQRYQNDRFGMFIHWGLYALIGRGEWVMHNERIPVPEYEALAARFNPSSFDAQAWVDLAAQAGQKYLVITSRHHDGFSMYDTALSSYKVTNSPFKRDPIRELAEACARRGDVRLGFYVSLLDWHHPAYRFRAESRLAWEDYLEFLHGQVRELCTQYGPLACIWFDGDWPRHVIDESNAYFLAGGSFEYERLYATIHNLQPDAVVMNNRHADPLPGEDVQGFEQDLPGQNSAGFNTTSVTDHPLEVCMTINDNWGLHTGDANHKSSRRLVHILARYASAGANLLLNIGPTPSGEILPVHTQRLREMGAWLGHSGASIYGTRAGLIPAQAEAVSTRRGGRNYLHILEYPSDCLSVRGAPAEVSQAALLKDGSSVKMELHAGELRLTIPAEQRDAIDTVVVLE